MTQASSCLQYLHFFNIPSRLSIFGALDAYKRDQLHVQNTVRSLCTPVTSVFTVKKYIYIRLLTIQMVAYFVVLGSTFDVLRFIAKNNHLFYPTLIDR